MPGTTLVLGSHVPVHFPMPCPGEWGRGVERTGPWGAGGKEDHSQGNQNKTGQDGSWAREIRELPRRPGKDKGGRMKTGSPHLCADLP